MKIATYPIPGDSKGGELHLYGDLGAKNIALAIPGFPDDQSLMAPMAEYLSSKGILVGITCLPGYQVTDKKNWKDHPKSGYTLEQIVSCINEAVKTLRKEATNPSAKFTAIFFDWGVFVGQVWANRALEEGDSSVKPDQLVLLDILAPPHPSTKNIPPAKPMTFYEKSVQFIYRAVLASSYVLLSHGFNTLAKMVMLPSFITLGALNLGPTRQIDAAVFEEKSKTTPPDLDQMIYMAYPYYYLFKVRRRSVHLPYTIAVLLIKHLLLLCSSKSFSVRTSG